MVERKLDTFIIICEGCGGYGYRYRGMKGTEKVRCDQCNGSGLNQMDIDYTSIRAYTPPIVDPEDD